MSLVSIAFVDRNDELLFAKEFASRSYGSIDFEQKEEGHSIISTSAFQCSLRHQFLLQSGLENLNQMIEKGSMPLYVYIYIYTLFVPSFFDTITNKHLTPNTLLGRYI